MKAIKIMAFLAIAVALMYAGGGSVQHLATNVARCWFQIVVLAAVWLASVFFFQQLAGKRTPLWLEVTFQLVVSIFVLGVFIAQHTGHWTPLVWFQ